jgi:hypothetical protein
MEFQPGEREDVVAIREETLTRKASCNMVGQISWKISVGMVKRSKWCSSSICSKLTGTLSGSDRAHQSTSRGSPVAGGESSLPGVPDDNGGAGARTHRSPLLTQLEHGSFSSHCWGSA